MDTNILNYRVIVEPDVRTGSNKPCFCAYCPTLGVADDGDTIDEALSNLKEGMELYVETLIEDNKEVPLDKVENSVITSIHIPLTQPQMGRINFA